MTQAQPPRPRVRFDRFCVAKVTITAAQAAQHGELWLDDRSLPCPEKAEDGSDYCRFHGPLTSIRI